MRLGIFTSTVGRQYGGTETVDTKMIPELTRLADRDEIVVYCMNQQARRILDTGAPNQEVRVLRPESKWINIPISLPFELYRRPVDLLHATFVAPPVVPCPFVWTISCWSQYPHPEFYPPTVRWRLVYLFDRAIRRAEAVLCYSSYLRDRLIERFDYDPERAFVTRPGASEECHYIEDRDQVSEFVRSKGIEQPFVLYVGKLIKRKNVSGLVRAYHRLRERNLTAHKLVLLGGATWVDDDIPGLVNGWVSGTTCSSFPTAHTAIYPGTTTRPTLWSFRRWRRATGCRRWKRWPAVHPRSLHGLRPFQKS